jgi:hypothetical protein
VTFDAAFMPPPNPNELICNIANISYKPMSTGEEYSKVNGELISWTLSGILYLHFTGGKYELRGGVTA